MDSGAESEVEAGIGSEAETGAGAEAKGEDGEVEAEAVSEVDSVSGPESRSVGGSITIFWGDEGGTAVGSSDRTKSLYSSIARSLPCQSFVPSSPACQRQAHGLTSNAYRRATYQSLFNSSAFLLSPLSQAISSSLSSSPLLSSLMIALSPSLSFPKRLISCLQDANSNWEL